MLDTSYTTSPGGVRRANDFRDNLIIDRYDPIFASMRGQKLTHLRSENSEDAVTWNIFRSVRQIEPSAWLPDLCRRGLPEHSSIAVNAATVSLWMTVPPPAALLESGDEGDSEIDVVIESPTWVWFIEAKYHSDISIRTTTRPLRDQVLRNIDVGSYYAGVRPFFFSLLIQSEARSPLGVEAVRRYSSFVETRARLADHRPDGLANLHAVSLLTWSDLAIVLGGARANARRMDEQGFAERALAWMKARGLSQILESQSVEA